VSGQTLQRKELRTTLGLSIDTTNSGKVKKQEGIHKIGLIHADEGLAVIRSHLRIEAVNKGIEGHKALVGRQKISDVDTVERRRFKGKDNGFKRAIVHQSADAFCNFNCTGAIIRNRNPRSLLE